VRPISGLDNCFTGSHVSLTVVVVLVGYLFHVRMRHPILCLGAIIILSTFALGIHWIPDILAGVAVAVSQRCAVAPPDAASEVGDRCLGATRQSACRG
jgi:hypothetical protein